MIIKYLELFFQKQSLHYSTVLSIGETYLEVQMLSLCLETCWSSSILTAYRGGRFTATEINFCRSNSACLIQGTRWLSCHLYNPEFLNYIDWTSENGCIKTYGTTSIFSSWFFSRFLLSLPLCPHISLVFSLLSLDEFFISKNRWKV